MNRSSRQKIKKATEIKNDITEELDLIDIFQDITSKNSQITLFSSSHGTLSRIDHIVGQKISTLKETISSIFSDHNGMKLCIEIQKKTNEKILIEIHHEKRNEK